jgi:hypothetical protein
MATIKELESALINAHDAGDTKAAGILAGEIKKRLGRATGRTTEDVDEPKQSTFELSKTPARPEGIIPDVPGLESIYSAPSAVVSKLFGAEPNVSKFLAQSLLKGGSGLARGLFSLLPDVLGEEELGRDIRRAIPKPTGGLYGTDVGGTIAQYAIPAIGGAKVGGALLRGAGKLPKYIGALTGAAAGDVAATVPEEAQTIGSLLGFGPTKITPEDTALERRLKVGAEALPVGLATDVALYPARKFLSAPMDVESMTARRMQAEAIDLPTAITDIEKNIQAVRPEGYTPTTGELTEDIGISAIQNKVSRTPKLVDRKTENMKVLSREIESFKNVSEDPYVVTSEARKFIDDVTSDASERINIAQTSLATAEDDLLGEVASIASASPRDVQEEASKKLTDVLTQENVRLRDEANRLYAAIDPEGSVSVDLRPLSVIAKEIRTPESALKVSEVDETLKYGKGVFDAIDLSLNEQLKKNSFQSYKDLMKFRSNVNASISRAFTAGSTEAVQNLSKIKDGIDRYTELLSDFGVQKSAKGAENAIAPHTHFREVGVDAANAAVRANDFYKNEYVPKFKQSLGGKFAEKSRSGKLYPTETARSFLMGPTEGVQQLRKIIDDSANLDVAENSVRRFLIAQMSQGIFDKSGKVVPKTANKFYRDYQPVLAQFPEIDSEVKNIAKSFELKAKKVDSLASELNAAKKAQQQSNKDLQDSVFRFFTNEAEPDVVFRNVFASDSPEAYIKELKTRFGDNPQFMDSLKSNVSDFIVRTTKNPALDGDVALPGVLKVLDNSKTQRALSELYTPKEIARLSLVKETLANLESIPAGVAPQQFRTEIGSGLGEKARIILASIYGITTGRGIFALSSMISNLVNPDRVADVSRDLLTRSMLDPELALLMLKKDVSGNREALKTYILNNIIGSEGEED